jgi:hypothetical protein
MAESKQTESNETAGRGLQGNVKAQQEASKRAQAEMRAAGQTYSEAEQARQKDEAARVAQSRKAQADANAKALADFGDESAGGGYFLEPRTGLIFEQADPKLARLMLDGGFVQSDEGAYQAQQERFALGVPMSEATRIERARFEAQQAEAERDRIQAASTPGKLPEVVEGEGNIVAAVETVEPAESGRRGAGQAGRGGK